MVERLRKPISIENLVIRHGQFWLAFVFILTCVCWLFVHADGSSLSSVEESVLFVSFLGLSLAISRSVFALLLREATRPIWHLISHLNASNVDEFNPSGMTQEIKELYAIINDEIKKLRNAEAAAKKVECEIERAKLAGQIIHDIKSALLVIQFESKGSSELLRRSISRISKVLDELTVQKPLAEKLSFPGPILLQMRQEMEVVYPHAKLEMRQAPWHLACIEMPATKIFRIFGNLFENAIQASAKRITFDVKCDHQNLIDIVIADDGQGMSEDVRRRILTIGGSYNKPGGKGLGLSWVLNEVKAHGGKVRIRSTLRRGTTIWLSLPKAIHPSWYVSHFTAARVATMAIDPLSQEKIRGRVPWCEESPTQSWTYSDIVFTSGERVANTTNVLISGSDDLEEIQKIFEQWQGPIVPKALLPFLEVVHRPRSYVYLDEEANSRRLWDKSAKMDGISCSIFASSKDLFANLRALPRESIFCIAANLHRDSRNSAEIATCLYNLGYRNLFLAKEPGALDAGPVPAHVIRIVDKSPFWRRRVSHVVS